VATVITVALLPAFWRYRAAGGSRATS